jgi:hypothetical protein
MSNNVESEMKKLTKWFKGQNWLDITFEVSVREYNKEINVLIKSYNIENIKDKLMNYNFEKDGLKIKYKSYEKSSWDVYTYFIYFSY